MKNIKIFGFAAMALGMLAFTACEDDDKATYHDPTEFVLNTPVYSSGVVDLENSSSIELACSQPDYGFTAATTYSVQVSLTNDFTTDGAYSTLPTTYTTARMQVPAAELAEALTSLSTADVDEYPYTTDTYVRLKAQLTKSQKGEIYSNVVEFPVRLYYALPAMELPTQMYLVGSFCSWSWDTATKMIVTYDNNGTFWRLMYLDAGASFKFNTEKAFNGDEAGYAQVDGRVTDNAGASVSADGDGNISVANAGWYLIVVRTAISGRSYVYSIEFNEPNVYLFGSTKPGDNQWAADEDGLFTVPSDADGEFVSPAFAADADPESGVRACVIIGDEEWWHSEFMVFNGELVYRETGGDQERVTASAGQRLYINFTAGTGHIN